MTDKCTARKTPCDSTKICNPKSGRCVLKTGAIGRNLVQPKETEMKSEIFNGKEVLNWTDPILLDDVKPEDAWYLTSNVRGDKIYHVYQKETINKLFQAAPRGQAPKGPTTREPMFTHHIKKLTDPSMVYLRSGTSLGGSASENIIRQRVNEMNLVLTSHIGRRWDAECDRIFKDLVIIHSRNQLTAIKGLKIAHEGREANVLMSLVNNEFHVFLVYGSDTYLYTIGLEEYEKLHRAFKTLTGTTRPTLVQYGHAPNPLLNNNLDIKIVTISSDGTTHQYV